MTASERALPLRERVTPELLPEGLAAGLVPRRARVDAGLKRTLDVAVSAFVLFVLAPLILLIALLVRLDSPGPVFYRATRIGHHGRELAMLKFRKMRDSASGLPLTTAGDERFTRIGEFLALTKLDELPQFWHVLRGDMSLVGPRPETRDFTEHHPSEYHKILAVRPGILGLSQIAFLHENRILDGGDPLSHYLTGILPQKVGLDVMYAHQRTLGLDLRIFVWSLTAVLLRRQVAVHRDTGDMNLRRR